MSLEEFLTTNLDLEHRFRCALLRVIVADAKRADTVIIMANTQLDIAVAAASGTFSPLSLRTVYVYKDEPLHTFFLVRRIIIYARA